MVAGHPDGIRFLCFTIVTSFISHLPVTPCLISHGFHEFFVTIIHQLRFFFLKVFSEIYMGLTGFLPIFGGFLKNIFLFKTCYAFFFS